MYHHDVYETHSQPEEVLSANRPPQLNETVCGCRCGYGDGGVAREGDGGNNDDDGATTLVGSDTSEMGDQFPASSDEAAQTGGVNTFPPSVPANGNGDEFRARIGLLMSNAEGLRVGQHVMDRAFAPYQLEFPQNYDDTADSLMNEPGSDIHSVAATAEARSVHCISPGPGIGAWDERRQELPMEYPLHYHFSVRPLRLTPQHRYCRGLVASHLVLQDETGFTDVGEGRLREDFGNSNHFDRL